MIMTPEMEVATKYQSHLPALLACVGDTVGDVLEIGMGHFSTLQLHSLLAVMDRKLVSVESDSEWYDHFYSMLVNSGHHKMMNTSYELALAELSKAAWSVTFIDHSPGGENRANAFRSTIGCSQYVVVHDYWDENELAIAPLLTRLDSHVTKTYLPPTLIASRVRKIPKVLLKL